MSTPSTDGSYINNSMRLTRTWRRTRSRSGEISKQYTHTYAMYVRVVIMIVYIIQNGLKEWSTGIRQLVMENQTILETRVMTRNRYRALFLLRNSPWMGKYDLDIAVISYVYVPAYIVEQNYANSNMSFECI